ncbi:glycerophosphodiester phosphodiesterase family protein [Lactiplantibacillus dongliensis]|uniref:Glycerophosphodiester phosphodiesterase family protein n=1 Tax=Lactiplantibacillus dongliensis TaxID=2559919 RepID=A0ABW1R396_9LACO|nr:glycerophosphodiester phosphodiesterase family protein [Lactiplantibacillus dongliensis]
MQRYWQILMRGQWQLTGPWLALVCLALLVKVVGVAFGGWSALVGLGLLSLCLPLSVTRWRFNRSFWLIWSLQLVLGLIWLPFGWGGYTATLQAGLTLSAPLQNAIFTTRYQWGPTVGVIWGLLWLSSFKWLPSTWQQFKQPTSWRRWWLAGWHQSFWQVVWQLIKLLRWLGCWVISALIGVGLTFGIERLNPMIGQLTSWLVLAGLLWELLVLLLAGLATAIQRPTNSKRPAWLVSGLLLLVSLVFAGWWLSGTVTTAPAIIAHRGVDGHNGVQNTTSALRRTVKATHPAAVEMDIQPTLDKHWVVMHDPTLSHLSQRRGPVRDYRIQQLIGLPLWENGERGQLSTFKQYLRAARQLHQPLLVEIKAVGPAADLMAPFGQAYAQPLRRAGSQVHSLDYAVVTRLKQHDPQLRVGYITPFNLTSFSANAADFYSLQALTLTREQLAAATRQRKPVYVWTPDGKLAQQRLAVLGVDGIITNQPGQLRRLMTRTRQVYTVQLINWLFNLL